MVGEYHLDLQNPKRYTIEDLPNFETPESFTALRKELEAAGHDGVMVDMRDVGGPIQYVVFKPDSVINRKAIETPAKPEMPTKQAEAERPPLPEVDEQALPDDATVIDDEGNAISFDEFKSRFAAEEAQVENTISQIVNATQCILANLRV